MSCSQPVSCCCLLSPSSARGAPPRRISSSLFRPRGIRRRARRPRPTWPACGRLRRRSDWRSRPRPTRQPLPGCGRSETEYIFLLTALWRRRALPAPNSPPSRSWRSKDRGLPRGHRRQRDGGSPRSCGLRCRAGQGGFRRVGRPRPDTLQLQLHCLDALAGAKDQSAALIQLVQAACLSGDAISTVSLREAAVTALQARPDAVESLFEARIAAGDDAEVCAALDTALAGIGEPAVETLVAAMGSRTGPTRYSLRSGSRPSLVSPGNSTVRTRGCAIGPSGCSCGSS